MWTRDNGEQVLGSDADEPGLQVSGRVEEITPRMSRGKLLLLSRLFKFRDSHHSKNSSPMCPVFAYPDILSWLGATCETCNTKNSAWSWGDELLKIIVESNREFFQYLCLQPVSTAVHSCIFHDVEFLLIYALNEVTLDPSNFAKSAKGEPTEADIMEAFCRAGSSPYSFALRFALVTCPWFVPCPLVSNVVERNMPTCRRFIENWQLSGRPFMLSFDNRLVDSGVPEGSLFAPVSGTFHVCLAGAFVFEITSAGRSWKRASPAARSPVVAASARVCLPYYNFELWPTPRELALIILGRSPPPGLVRSPVVSEVLLFNGRTRGQSSSLSQVSINGQEVRDGSAFRWRFEDVASKNSLNSDGEYMGDVTWDNLRVTVNTIHPLFLQMSCGVYRRSIDIRLLIVWSLSDGNEQVEVRTAPDIGRAPLIEITPSENLSLSWALRREF